MTLPDIINGAFELAGGLFVLNNCRALYRDKRVCGVSPLSTAIFTAWGFWNLFYYPHLGQWVSFAGGLGIVFGNAVWLAMALYYRRLPPRARA
jgi:hypothetical protein